MLNTSTSRTFLNCKAAPHYKVYLENFSLNTVWEIIRKLCKRPSQISQDPERGEELKSISRTAEASASQSAGLDRSELSPTNSSPADPQEEVGMSRIIQVTAHTPPALLEVPSVHKEVESQQGRLSFRLSSSAVQPTLSEDQESKVLSLGRKDTHVLQGGVSKSEKSSPRLQTLSRFGDQLGLKNNSESAPVVSPSSEGIPQVEDQSNETQQHDNGEQSGDSAQETSWKASFLIAIFSFTLGFIFTIVDMKNGVAIGVVERLNILAHYCLPFYWVILVDECYLVSKRIVRTWLAEYCSIYFD